ncbi:MAG: 50S ribosomal protein L6 [Cellvibrionales bacterium]|nr:50S ribosomal protein L6 [Cellvibrionales bacterium]
MSRVAKNPIHLPAGVSLAATAEQATIKGPKGEQTVRLHPAVTIEQAAGEIRIAPADPAQPNMAMAGTMRALLNNAVIGVSTGFSKTLQLSGVGYRAKVSGQKLDLTLGFSHPVVHQLPKEVTAETPSQTEIVLRSADKQLLGQVAAEVRAYRPPEPYKGKGVRYADEQIRLKEAKKK